jgi:predicted acyl esterase
LVSRLEAPKCMTMGPWIHGHPTSAIDQTDNEWTLGIASE